MTELWPHQSAACKWLDRFPTALLDAAMGTGKSLITIETIRRHVQERVLILCPAAVMPVWRGQFHDHAPGEFQTLVLDGRGISQSCKKKGENVHKFLQHCAILKLRCAVVVNYDSMIRPGLFDVLLAHQWCMVVADESHKIKGHGTQASKKAHRIGQRASRRIGLTGTPMPHDPGDIFGQYRFLDHTIFGTYWTQFKTRYAIMNRYIPQKVDRWVNQDEMIEKVNCIRYRIDRSVLTLPEVLHQTIEAPLSPTGMRHYREMLKNSVAKVREHEITAANGAVQFLRLLQFAQGYATGEDGSEIFIDNAKQKVLLELLEDVDEPVCVYGWFRHDLRVVRDCCEILGRRFGEISGAKKDIDEHGKMPEGIDVMGVQCKSGGSGISLVRSRIGIVLNSGCLSPGDYDQMMARQHRPGQTRPVMFYHVVAPGTVDVNVLKARQQKRDVVNAILEAIQ